MGINTVGRVCYPVAVTVALAGIGFVALHSQPRLGWWLIGCGLVVALGAAVVDGCRLGMHRRKLPRGTPDRADPSRTRRPLLSPAV